MHNVGGIADSKVNGQGTTKKVITNPPRNALCGALSKHEFLLFVANLFYYTGSFRNEKLHNGTKGISFFANLLSEAVKDLLNLVTGFDDSQVNFRILGHLLL